MSTRKNYRNVSNKIVWVIFITLLLLVSGCSHSAPNIYVRRGYDQSTAKKIAVFPFYNHTKFTGASRIVTDTFVASLVKQGKFRVEFSGNIKKFLIMERIIVRTGVDVGTIKLMGGRLGVDAVIIGRVDEFVGLEIKKKDVIPVVSISSRMVDARTGKILWMAEHKKNGDDYIKILDFGKIRSVGVLTKKVVDEMLETMP